MVCKNCGSEMNDKDLFCKNCGKTAGKEKKAFTLSIPEEKLEDIVIIKEESYIIEYNLTLLDAIITIPNDEIIYYNIENVPNYIKDDKFISYLEVLSNWKYL